jgi:hypothetical protein
MTRASRHVCIWPLPTHRHQPISRYGLASTRPIKISEPPPRDGCGIGAPSLRLSRSSVR